MNKKAYIEHFSRVYGVETNEATTTCMDKNTAVRVLVKTAADRSLLDKFKEFYGNNKDTFRDAAIGGVGGLLVGSLLGKEHRARSGLLGALLGATAAGGGRYAYDEFLKKNVFGESRHAFNNRVKDYMEQMKRYQSGIGAKPEPFRFHPGISPAEAAKLQGPVRPSLLQTAKDNEPQIPVLGLKEGGAIVPFPSPSTPLPSK